MLQLCISQEINTTPYSFKSTGISVYSIEEALYHTYHYWRESLDDFSTSKFTSWIEGLGEATISSKMRDITQMEPLSKRILAFLGIIEYFNHTEIAALQADLEAWEQRAEWEKLKTRADHFISQNEPAKALPLYRKALKHGENIPTLNNMAIAHMQLANHKAAAALLAKAHAQEPENQAINLHYTEALILSGDYEKANQLLSWLDNGKDTAYLYGLTAYQQGDYVKALGYFNQHPNITAFAHKIADTYLKMRMYDKALASLDPQDHEKIAEIYAAYGQAHLPEAIRHIRKAIDNGNQNNPALWTKLAGYYRKDYDNERASEAIAKALPAKTPAALLENARIKKSQSRMREYRSSLGDVIKQLKSQYREEE